MESSRAYYMSHILLRHQIFFDAKNFDDKLHQGPQVMKPYLLALWNSINENCFNEGTIITDIDRVVSIDDFDITYRNINGKTVFFFIMPEPDSYNVQAKAVALVIDISGNIRYITMEIWSSREEKMKEIFGEEYTPKYTIGEWRLKENDFVHSTLGQLERNTIECFASSLEKIL